MEWNEPIAFRKTKNRIPIKKSLVQALINLVIIVLVIFAVLYTSKGNTDDPSISYAEVVVFAS